MGSFKKAQAAPGGKSVMKSGLRIWDYLIFAAAAVFCFLVFQQRDLMHTAGCSYGYLNGHFMDFYDYCSANGIHPSYMPTSYLLFALWNIPMRLAGVVKVPTEDIPLLAVMWAKLLPCLVYLGSAPVIFHICMECGMQDKKSRLCTYACLTMPVAFYAQFIFGQYDIFMTFCTLCGLWAYLKKKDIWFVVWFAIAVTFKYSALLLFIPLLLLRCKDIFRIAGAMVLLVIPFALEYLLYRGSPAFAGYVFGLGGGMGDNPSGYILNASYFTGFALSALKYNVSLAVLAFGCICGLAYFTTPAREKLAGWVFYLSGLVFFVLFGLSKWHPQWLLFAVPYWVIGAFLHRDTKIFLVIDLVFMVIYTIFNVEMIPNNVDQAMLNNGVLGSLVGHNIGSELMMRDLIGKVSPELCLSLLTAIMLAYGLFRHPKYLLEHPEAEVSCNGWLRTRFIAGTAFFVLPALACLAAYLRSPDPGYSIGQTDQVSLLQELGDNVVQTFRSRGTTLDKLQFAVSVSGQVNNGYVKLTLMDEDDKILYEEDWQTSGWVERDIITADLGGIGVEEGAYYKAMLEATQASDDYRIGIYRSAGAVTDDPKETGEWNGRAQKGQYEIIVYQR